MRAGRRCNRKFTPRPGTHRKNCYECSPERASAAASPAPEPATVEVPVLAGAMERSVRARLEELGQGDSIAAAAAVRLAQDIDATPRGKGTGPMVAQLLKTLEPIEQLAPPPQDELSEFEQRARDRAARTGT